MPSDNVAKALAIIAPNVASALGGCCTGNICDWKNCCKSTGCCKCPLPVAVWHTALFAANSSTGYASYLVWKQLRGFVYPEHCTYSLFLLSSAFHPCLLSKCEKWGCGPAIVNSLCSVGLALCATHLFMKADRRAGYFMMPGLLLALLYAGCTFSCAQKRCCNKTDKTGGSCCPGGSCCKK